MAKISITIEGSLDSADIRKVLDALGAARTGVNHWPLTSEVAAEQTGDFAHTVSAMDALTSTGYELAKAELVAATEPAIDAWPGLTDVVETVDEWPGVTVPPAPTAAAPVPPVPPATAPAPTGVELDGEGLPWDKRIHASTKTKRQSDQTWKLMKGVDKDLVEQVKAELRATMAAPVPPAPAAAPVPPAPTAAAPVPPAPTAAAPVPPAPAAAPVPPVPPAPAAAPVPPAPTAMPTTFPEFIKVVTSKQQAGVLTVLDVAGAIKAAGLTALPLLASRPDLIPAVYAQLEAVWLTRS